MYSMRAGEWPEAQGAAAVPAAGLTGRAPEPHPGDRVMLIDFFYTLRSAKLPVSVKEYLTLLEALKEGVVGPNSATTATRSTTSTT
jgi:hypothetical protein